MATLVLYNGIQYSIPSNGEINWGTSLSAYLIAQASGSLNLSGGNFPLLSEVNVGPTWGIASPYFRSGNANPAVTGQVRFTNTEGVVWRNATNTGDLSLNLVGNALYFAGTPIGGGTASPLTTKGDLYTYALNNTRLPVGVNGTVLTADSSSSTGLSWLPGGGGGGGGSVTGFTFTNANGISGVVATPTTTPTLTLSLGAITPTSIVASGTIQASNFASGASVSGTHSGTSSGTNTGNQTITLTGAVTGSGTGSFATTLATVGIGSGGTGQVSANAAFNALAPSQAGNNGKLLYTDGTNTSWQTVGGGTGVSSVSVTVSNGITGSVSNPTTTPNVILGLGAITPSSVNASGTVLGSNISGTSSGTNTGDQTISLTGDVTGTGTGTFATTLATTTVVAGSYARASITVDAKGRITSAAANAAQTITLTGDVTGTGTGTFAATLANTGVTSGTGYNLVDVDSKGRVVNASTVAYLTANQTITVSGDATGSGTTALALTLANTAVSAGTYTTPSSITVDAKGRITSIANGTPGTVNSVSVVNANGVSGSVANPTTTPAITLTLGNITPNSIVTSGGSLTGLFTTDLTELYSTASGSNGLSQNTAGTQPALSSPTWSPVSTYSGVTARQYYLAVSGATTINRPVTLGFGSLGGVGYTALYIGPITTAYNFDYNYIIKNTTGSPIALTWTGFTSSASGSTASIIWGASFSGVAYTSLPANTTVIVRIKCVTVGTRGAGTGALAYTETFYASKVDTY